MAFIYLNTYVLMYVYWYLCCMHLVIIIFLYLEMLTGSTMAVTSPTSSTPGCTASTPTSGTVTRCAPSTGKHRYSHDLF